MNNSDLLLSVCVCVNTFADAFRISLESLLGVEDRTAFLTRSDCSVVDYTLYIFGIHSIQRSTNRIPIEVKVEDKKKQKERKAEWKENKR